MPAQPSAFPGGGFGLSPTYPSEDLHHIPSFKPQGALEMLEPSGIPAPSHGCQGPEATDMLPRVGVAVLGLDSLVGWHGLWVSLDGLASVLASSAVDIWS